MIPIKVVSIDVGGVLGTCPDLSLGAAFARLSHLPAEQVSTVLAQRLYRCSELTDGLLADVAGDLGLATAVVREILATPRPLRMHSRARECITGLRREHPHLRVVVCSNVSIADADQVATVRATLSGLVDDYVFSYEQGMAKPDPELFGAVEDRMGAAGEEIVHVGDRVAVDVDPALRAGWRALLVHPEHAATSRPARPRRYRSAADLPDAVAELGRWLAESRAAVRPTLPVRAAVRLRDEHGRIAIVRGPDDAMHSLAGGRVETIGAENPATAAVRETNEELGLRVRLGELLWAGSSQAEASNGDNKIVFVFDAEIEGDNSEPSLDPAEVVDLRWVTRVECAQLLHPREADRLERIDRGETSGWQAD